MPVNRKHVGGFTYFGILLTVALIGASLSALGASWSVQSKRAMEEQLLFAGQAYRRAIASYYNRPAIGGNHYPATLQSLLLDERGGRPVRHLRELYPDPMSGKADWQLVTLADGAIIGVVSTTIGQPLKKSNFGTWEASFEGADCYCDWQFVYLPQLIESNGNASQQ